MKKRQAGWRKCRPLGADTKTEEKNGPQNCFTISEARDLIIAFDANRTE